MTVITTRPSATKFMSQPPNPSESSGGGWTVHGGGGGAHGALNDDDDASYLELGGSTDVSWLKLRFGVPNVPTGAIIIQDLIAFRLASITPPDIPADPDGAPGIHYEPFPFRLANMWIYPSGNSADPASTSPPEDPQHLEKKIGRVDYMNGDPKTLYVAVVSCRSDLYPLGFPHTNPELWLNMRTFGNFTDGYRGRLYEIIWGTQYVRQPTLTIQEPTGVITDDDSPKIGWANDLDAAGGGQTSFRWKAFDSAAFS
jgi:hypothetical protein